MTPGSSRYPTNKKPGGPIYVDELVERLITSRDPTEIQRIRDLIQSWTTTDSASSLYAHYNVQVSHQ